MVTDAHSSRSKAQRRTTLEARPSGTQQPNDEAVQGSWDHAVAARGGRTLESAPSEAQPGGTGSGLESARSGRD
jgi:hypothetical protein